MNSDKVQLMTHRIPNELTVRNKVHNSLQKLLIAILANCSYLRAWTYLLKIYKKRSQFASKSITCNDAFPLFCEVYLKGQPVPQPAPQSADATSRLPPEQSLRQLPELVGQGREAWDRQRQ